MDTPSRPVRTGIVRGLSGAGGRPARRSRAGRAARRSAEGPGSGLGTAARGGRGPGTGTRGGRVAARLRVGGGVAALVAVLGLGVSGCAAETPAALPTVGSPSPSPTQVQPDTDRAAQLARRWGLAGAELPGDWPDVPLPRDTEVITAYAIGVEPRRTWTATFAADRGTALDLAEPVVAELRERGYQPIAAYVGAAATNTGLYSFAAPTFAVYLVLGEDDGRPNLVVTVRGSPSAAEPTRPAPAAANPTPSTSGSATAPTPLDPAREASPSPAPSTNPAAPTG